MNTPAHCGAIKPPKPDIYSEAPHRRLRRWLGPRLDIHIEPARHPLLNIERRPTMTHQIDQLHATIVPRVANGVPILKPRTGQRHQHQVWK